jgi:hypothetical protein
MAARRKTLAEVRADAKAKERDYLLSAVCRILKHHLGEQQAADRLFKATKNGTTIDGLAQSGGTPAGLD